MRFRGWPGCGPSVACGHAPGAALPVRKKACQGREGWSSLTPSQTCKVSAACAGDILREGWKPDGRDATRPGSQQPGPAKTDALQESGSTDIAGLSNQGKSGLFTEFLAAELKQA